MPEPEIESVEKRLQTQFTRWSTFILLAAILCVAAMVSALTAMRFAIQRREVKVPDLAGKTQVQAEEILRAKGLKLTLASSRFSFDVPEGRVLEQIPPSGTSVKVDSSVKALLSLGPRRFPVPNLVGASLRAAQLMLGQRQFMLGNTLYAHTPDGENSTVVYQTPEPGTQEGADPSVNILISLGPPAQYYVMPDLIGKPAALVASRARSEGFRIGNINYRKYPGIESGIVIQQKPQAGYRLDKSEAIFLDVSQ